MNIYCYVFRENDLQFNEFSFFVETVKRFHAFHRCKRSPTSVLWWQTV